MYCVLQSVVMFVNVAAGLVNSATLTVVSMTYRNTDSTSLIAGKHLPPYSIVVDFSGFRGFLTKTGQQSHPLPIAMVAVNTAIGKTPVVVAAEKFDLRLSQKCTASDVVLKLLQETQLISWMQQTDDSTLPNVNRVILHIDHDELIARYRMPRHMIAEICEMLDEDLRRISRRSQPLPVSTQVMVGLRYFATGSFQRGTGDLHGISQPSASRCIRWTDITVSSVSATRIYLGPYCRRIAAVILK